MNHIFSKRLATLWKSCKLILIIQLSPSFFLLATSQASLKLTHELDGCNFGNLQRHYLRANLGKWSTAGSLDRSCLLIRRIVFSSLLCGLSSLCNEGSGSGRWVGPAWNLRSRIPRRKQLLVTATLLFPFFLLNKYFKNHNSKRIWYSDSAKYAVENSRLGRW